MVIMNKATKVLMILIDQSLKTCILELHDQLQKMIYEKVIEV